MSRNRPVRLKLRLPHNRRFLLLNRNPAQKGEAVFSLRPLQKRKRPNNLASDGMK